MSRLGRAITARMGFFLRPGYLEQLPSPWQVEVGFKAMLPITLSESPRERERSRQTWLGQVPIRVPLQILYSPRQLLVDTGLTQSPRQVIRHLLCVYHEDAFLSYDLQLLQSHPQGLEKLAEQAQRVVSGKTLWAPLLQRLVGWPLYHQRLIELASAAARFDYPDPMDLDQRFSSLVGFARFCCTLPDWPAREFYGFDLARIKRDA